MWQCELTLFGRGLLVAVVGRLYSVYHTRISSECAVQCAQSPLFLTPVLRCALLTDLTSAVLRAGDGAAHVT
jgi:hypothetical protein